MRPILAKMTKIAGFSHFGPFWRLKTAKSTKKPLKMAFAYTYFFGPPISRVLENQKGQLIAVFMTFDLMKSPGTLPGKFDFRGYVKLGGTTNIGVRKGHF